MLRIRAPNPSLRLNRLAGGKLELHQDARRGAAEESAKAQRAAARHLEMSIGGNMYMLRIEHPVPNYAGWKKAFDGDPALRKKSGVRRYQILRPVDNPNYVMIDLEFDTPKDAETLLAGLRLIWGRVEGTLMSDPKARIVEAVETTAL